MENKKVKMILNEIYVMIYENLEGKVIDDLKEYIEMWSLVTKKRNSTEERRFIRICPEEIEEKVLLMEKLILSSNLSENDIKTINQFVIACMGVIQYEELESKVVNINIDKLYYQAALKQFFIENKLINKEDKYDKFSNEFSQVGQQIGIFYKLISGANNEDKLTNLAKMIANKTTELFKRYNFNYSLPICSNRQLNKNM